MAENYCFGTLAVGQRYRKHAQVLAEDIQQHAPGVWLIVLTDRPADFASYPQVRPVRHRLQSVKGYHDKRFVVAKALETFETCIFLDADVRIIGAVPETMEFLPGITARHGCGILKHNTRKNRDSKALPLIRDTAHRLNLDLQDVPWLHEFMFAFTRQADLSQDFFDAWEEIANFFQSKGIYGGEGNVMGLAAEKVGISFRLKSHDWFPLFKDNIEKERIKNGQSSPTVKKAYFEEHREIEYPKRTLLGKVVHKLQSKTSFWYRLLKFRATQSRDNFFLAP